MSDTLSLEAIVQALYDTISGHQGEPRDWNRFRSLFFPHAYLISTTLDASGQPQANVRTVEEFIQYAEEYFQLQSFYENEIAHQTESFGNIAHVFSTYEARLDKDPHPPFKRGINSIQLFNDGNRWWVVNMLWDDERDNNPIVERYLPK